MTFDIDPKDENYERDLLLDEIKKLTEQRDALLVALNEIATKETSHPEGCINVDAVIEILNTARAAIAAMENKS